MAAFLKQEFDLIVLKVDLVETGPEVLATLQAKSQGELQDVRHWNLDLSEMGLCRSSEESARSNRARSREDSMAGSLPAPMLAELNAWLADNGKEGAPVWVHLVKPYGALRFFPWERALRLNAPVLMLPDFIFPPPRESENTLDVLLCGSAPLNREDYLTYDAVQTTLARILEAAPRRTRVHVFVDAAMMPSLSQHFASEVARQVFLYPQSGAQPYTSADPSRRLVDRAGFLRSPWLLWMREALAGRTIDVAHFVCHGHLTRDRGALLLAQSPLDRTDDYLAGPVGQMELATFLTQVGAWSCALTSVQDNNSEPGLRALADELAQTRPGPVLMHTLAHDQNAGALVGAYRLLYGREPHPVPRSASLFIYCQPYRVKGIARRKDARQWRDPALESRIVRNPRQNAFAGRSTDNTSPLDAAFEHDNVGRWAASTERFAEQVELRVQRRARDQSIESVGSEASTQTTFDTLDKLRAAVARVAGTGPSKPGGGGS